jgi:SAM-dependent methyltransferase
MAVNYDSAAPGYRRTRTVGSTVLDEWRRVVAPFFDSGVRTIVDVGAGTGQFARPLSDWFGVRVVALEPSDGMRATADRHDRVHFVAGTGEALPLASRAIDLAWLSAVVHHFTDLARAFAELRRVLRQDGLVLVRGFFSDLDPPLWFTSFPGIDRSVDAFPSSEQVAEALGTQGLSVIATSDVLEVHEVADPWEPRLRELRSVDSLLRPLTDAEFEAGVAELRVRLGSRGDTVEHRATLRLLVGKAT